MSTKEELIRKYKTAIEESEYADLWVLSYAISTVGVRDTLRKRIIANLRCSGLEPGLSTSVITTLVELMKPEFDKYKYERFIMNAYGWGGSDAEYIEYWDKWSDSFGGILFTDRQKSRIDEVLATLTDRERFVTKKRYFEDADYTCDAIGEMTGVSKSAVMQTHDTALRKFRQYSHYGLSIDAHHRDDSFNLMERKEAARKASSDEERLEILDTVYLSDLDLSTRAYNVVARATVKCQHSKHRALTIRDVVRALPTRELMEEQRNAGTVTVDEIVNALSEFGCDYGANDSSKSSSEASEVLESETSVEDHDVFGLDSTIQSLSADVHMPSTGMFCIACGKRTADLKIFTPAKSNNGSIPIVIESSDPEFKMNPMIAVCRNCLKSAGCIESEDANSTPMTLEGRLEWLEQQRSDEIKGYRHAQISLLKDLLAEGAYATLLKKALSHLNIEVLDVLEDVDQFYDSSALLSNDDSVFTRINDDLLQHIKTYNIGSIRLQYPAPTKEGKIEGHTLVAWDQVKNSLTRFTLKGNEIVISEYGFHWATGLKHAYDVVSKVIDSEISMTGTEAFPNVDVDEKLIPSTSSIGDKSVHGRSIKNMIDGLADALKEGGN